MRNTFTHGHSGELTLIPLVPLTELPIEFQTQTLTSEYNEARNELAGLSAFVASQIKGMNPVRGSQIKGRNPVRGSWSEIEELVDKLSTLVFRIQQEEIPVGGRYPVGSVPDLSHMSYQRMLELGTLARHLKEFGETDFSLIRNRETLTALRDARRDYRAAIAQQVSSILKEQLGIECSLANG